GRKKGDVLISYITEPFTLAPSEPFSNLHTMYWECYEIVQLFREKGYACDIVNANNTRFVPKKPYVVYIDTENSIERLSKHLPKNCKKVFYILISYWKAYNDAEKCRLDALEKRRGVRLLPRRKMLPSRNALLADYLVGFGNKAIFNTFKQFNKPIFFIPISSVVKYDFPDQKDWIKARKNFLWIGGGGAVLKGLDIALEAFAMMPDLQLHVCGPVAAEKDFVDAYKKELFETPNIHVYGRIDVGGSQFAQILDTCAAVVYPSGGEGSSGAIVQAMHAGLVPIVTHETGIQESAGYIPLEKPTPESIMKTVREFSDMPEEKIREFSKKIWSYSREHYTRESFSAAYEHFIEDILKI
ncbi:MAG: glycosyltransferase, partial [Patescibacteria group bacterium]